VNHQLSLEKQQLEQKLADLRAKVRSAESALAKLQQQLKKSEKQKQDLVQARKARQQQLEKQQQKQQELELDFASFRHEMAARSSLLEQQLLQQQTRCRELEAVISQLQMEHKLQLKKLKQEKNALLQQQQRQQQQQQQQTVLVWGDLSTSLGQIDDDGLKVLSAALADEQVSRRLCVVCLDLDARVLFLPCKHQKVCQKCAELLDTCPYCQTVVADKILPF